MRRALALIIGLACAMSFAQDEQLVPPGRAVLQAPFTTPGPLIEDTAETVFHWTAATWNLIRLPDDPSQTSSGWQTAGAFGNWNAVTVTLNAGAAPSDAPMFGPPLPAAQAYRVTFGAGSSARLARAAVVPGATYTCSVWVKGDVGSFSAGVELVVGNAGAYVRVVGKTIAITPATGWTRVSATTTIASSGENQIECGPGTQDGTAAGQSILAFGAQLVRGTVPLRYQQAPLANAIEGPNAFDVSTIWQRVSAGGGTAPVIGALARAPDGTFTARTVTFDRGFLSGGWSMLGRSLTALVPSAGTYTGSIWMRKTDGALPNSILRLGILVPGGQAGSIVTITPQWQRFAVTAVATGAGNASLTIETAGIMPTSVVATVDLWMGTVSRTDQNGDTLAMTGAVPVASTSPLFPTGTGAGRRFVGPFTDANYFSLAAGHNLAFPDGNFTICTAFVPNTATNAPVFIDNGVAHGSGYQLLLGASGGLSLYVKPAVGSSPSANAPIYVSWGVLNVWCGGMKANGDGTYTAYSRVNASPTAGTTTITGWIPGNTTFKIGAYSTGRALLDGRIHEVWMSSAPYDDAVALQIQANALANGGKEVLFPDDANTLLHLSGNAYDGATWAAPQVTFTTNGAVGYSDVWVPPVAGSLQRQGYGPYADANYFSLGSGPDALDFRGDFSACFVFQGANSYSTSPVLFENGSYPASGWATMFPGGPQFKVANWNGAEQAATTSNGAVSGLNVGCVGRAGTTLYAKLNLGAIASAGGATTVVGSSTTAFLGRYVTAGQSFSGPVYEAWFSTETPSDALFTKIQSRVLQQLSAHGVALTTTRSTAASFDVANASSQTLYTAPADVTVGGPSGIEEWRASTNLILNATYVGTTMWGGSNVSYVVPPAMPSPDGTANATQVNWTSTSGYFNQALGAPTVGVPYTFSIWLRGANGTEQARLLLDGGYGGSVMSSIFTLTPGWQRYSLSVTGVSTAAGWAYVLVGPSYGMTNAQTIYAWGGQLEAQPYPTPFIPTAGTAVARNATVSTIPNPIPANVPHWCLRFTAVPGAGHSWADGQSHTFLSSGAYGSANSFSVSQDAPGTLTFEVYDTTTTARWVSTTGFWDSNAHDIAACAGSGTPYFVIDGVRASGVVGGTGTGILTAPQSTLTLGSSGGTANWTDGAVRDVKVCDYPVGACAPPATSSSTLAYYPFDRSGTFATDANTVANVTWNGTALVDPYSVVTPWTMNGTVPQNVASPFYPEGFSDAQAKGAGPYSDANYYQLGSGSDALDFDGDFTLCAEYVITAIPSGGNWFLLSNGHATAGWGVRLNNTTGVPVFQFYDGALQGLGAPAASVLNGPNVVCVGKASGTCYLKLNLGVTQTLGCGTITGQAGVAARLGRYGAAGAPAVSGWLAGVWASASAWNETNVLAQQQRVFGALGTSGETVTTVRSTTATGIAPDGMMWTWPSGVARVACDGSSATKCGLLVEPASTNDLLRSQELGNAYWTPNAAASVVTDAATGPDGTATADALYALSTDQTTLSRLGLGTTAANPYTLSVYAKNLTAGYVVLSLYDGGANVRRQWFDLANGRVGSTTVGGTLALLSSVIQPMGNGWYRVVMTVTAPGANLNVYLDAASTNGVLSATAGQAIYAWGIQFEAGGYATSYVPTTTTAVARSVDQITGTDPFAAANPSTWCVDGIYTPESGRSWNGTNALWSVGTSYSIAGGRALSAISGGTLRYYSESGTAAFQWTQNYLAGSTHRVPVGVTLPSGWLFSDALNAGAVATGTPTQTAAAATLNLGASGSGAPNPWGGFMRNLRFCNSACSLCR